MQLFFRVQGEGFPIIILHGLFGSSDNWLTVTKKLTENYKVYLVDQRNHGRSPHDDEFTYSAMADDLNDFYEQNGIKEAFLIGHSMGGKVAMHFAVNHDEKVRRLIVADIGPKFYPRHHDTIIQGLKSIDLEKTPTRAAADNTLSQFVPELEVRQFLLKNLARENDKFFWRVNLPIIEKEIENIGEALSPDHEFSKPTLFIRGGKSRYILDEDLSLIKDIFPNSELKTIEKAGHWVQAEAPMEFLSLVEEFLKTD
jgi:esterase